MTSLCPHSLSKSMSCLWSTFLQHWIYTSYIINLRLRGYRCDTLQRVTLILLGFNDFSLSLLLLYYIILFLLCQAFFLFFLFSFFITSFWFTTLILYYLTFILSSIFFIFFGRFSTTLSNRQSVQKVDHPSSVAYVISLPLTLIIIL